MKSSAQGNKVRTSCKECLFAVYKGNTQVGCEHDRISSFEARDEIIEAYDNDKEFFVVDRVCNYFRPPKWNDGNADIDLSEVESSVNCVVIVNIPSPNPEELKKTVASIAKLDYNRKRFSVVFSHAMAMKDRDSLSPVMSSMPEDIEHTIVLYVSSGMQYYETMRDRDCTHFIKLESGQEIDSSIISDVNSSINTDLEKAVTYSKGSLNVIQLQAYLAQYNINDDFDNFITSLIDEATQSGLHSNL